MVRDLSKYLKGDKRIDEWLTTHVLPSIKSNQVVQRYQLEHVLDFLNSNDSPRRIKRLGLEDAIRLSNEWTEQLNKKYKSFSQIESKSETLLYKSYSNRFFWVKLVSKNSYEREGSLMGHCVGSYSEKHSVIYSLRDANNMPHATIEVCEGSITQIKGKQNKEVVEKYHSYILDFIKTSAFLCQTDDLHNLNAFQVMRSGKNLIIQVDELEQEDSIIDSINHSIIKAFPFSLKIDRLVINGKEEIVNIPAGWKINELIIYNQKRMFAKNIDCNTITLRSSKLEAESISVKDMSCFESLIEVKELSCRDAMIEKCVIRCSHISIEDAAITDTVVHTAKYEGTYLIYKSQLESKDFLSKIDITHFLELKGSFYEEIILPKLTVKTLSLRESNINLVPKHVRVGSLFVRPEALIEGSYEELYQ